jgi:hypothetical protein
MVIQIAPATCSLINDFIPGTTVSSSPGAFLGFFYVD